MWILRWPTGQNCLVMNPPFKESTNSGLSMHEGAQYQFTSTLLHRFLTCNINQLPMSLIKTQRSRQIKTHSLGELCFSITGIKFRCSFGLGSLETWGLCEAKWGYLFHGNWVGFEAGIPSVKARMISFRLSCSYFETAHNYVFYTVACQTDSDFHEPFVHLAECKRDAWSVILVTRTLKKPCIMTIYKKNMNVASL